MQWWIQGVSEVSGNQPNLEQQPLVNRGLNVSTRYKRPAPWAKWWLVKISNSQNGCRCATHIGVKCLGGNVLMEAHLTHDNV